MVTGRPFFENIFYVYPFNIHTGDMHAVTLEKLVLR